MATEKTSDKKVPDSCPHCGNKLSSWQQVLLKVDRAIVCKNCWYRILLDNIPEEKENIQNKKNNSTKKAN